MRRWSGRAPNWCLPRTDRLRLPAAGPPLQAAVRGRHRGLAPPDRARRRRHPGARRHGGEEHLRGGTAVLQRRRLLPPGQGRRDGPQMPAAHLRRVRRGPVFRTGGPADDRQLRGRARRHHDLRGHLDASGDQHPPPLPRPRPGQAARRAGLRPDDQHLGQPLAQRKGRRPPDPRDRRRFRAGLPGGLRERGRRQRRAHLRRAFAGGRRLRPRRRRPGGLRRGAPGGGDRARAEPVRGAGPPARPLLRAVRPGRHLRRPDPRPARLRAQERLHAAP